MTSELYVRVQRNNEFVTRLIENLTKNELYEHFKDHEKSSLIEWIWFLAGTINHSEPTHANLP